MRREQFWNGEEKGGRRKEGIPFETVQLQHLLVGGIVPHYSYPFFSTTTTTTTAPSPLYLSLYYTFLFSRSRGGGGKAEKKRGKKEKEESSVFWLPHNNGIYSLFVGCTDTHSPF